MKCGLVVFLGEGRKVFYTLGRVIVLGRVVVVRRLSGFVGIFFVL